MSTLIPERRFTALSEIIVTLTVDQLSEIYDDYVAYKLVGTTGETLLRKTTRLYLQKVSANTGTSQIISPAWLRAVAEEAMIKLVQHYRSTYEWKKNDPEYQG